MIPQIICVVGPTATGKTKMGVALAHRFGGEVVSVDSMQIYRGMAIGTAAPTPEEMEGIPHHMVGVACLLYTSEAAGREPVRLLPLFLLFPGSVYFFCSPASQ